MNSTIRLAVATATVLATTVAAFGSAEARKLYPRYHAHKRVVVVGNAGVIIGPTVLRPRHVRPHAVIIRQAPVYVAPAPVIIDRTYDDDLPLYDEPDYADERVYGEDDYLGDQGYEPGDYEADQQGDDPDYFPPAPRRKASEERYQDDERQAGAMEPWSDEWRAFCQQRYRTFNPAKGTYRGVDGRDHFCTAS